MACTVAVIEGLDAGLSNGDGWFIYLMVMDGFRVMIYLQNGKCVDTFPCFYDYVSAWYTCCDAYVSCLLTFQTLLVYLV